MIEEKKRRLARARYLTRPRALAALYLAAALLYVCNAYEKILVQEEEEVFWVYDETTVVVVSAYV